MNEKQELQVREKKELKEEATREGPHFTPDVDIYETDKALVLVGDVPGASGDRIELDLRDNVLSLNVTIDTVDRKWNPIYLEYDVGHFTRQFRLGQLVDQSKIEAEVKDGVLKLSIPKVEKAQPRKIQVNMR